MDPLDMGYVESVEVHGDRLADPRAVALAAGLGALLGGAFGGRLGAAVGAASMALVAQSPDGIRLSDRVTAFLPSPAPSRFPLGDVVDGEIVSG